MGAKRKTKRAGPHEPGRVARVSIEGFKSIARQQIDLGRLNVLIGPNGVGKSAILEAIGLLGAAAEGRVDAGELWRRGVRPSAPALFTTALGRKVASEIKLSATSQDGAAFAVTLAPPDGNDWPTLWRFAQEVVTIGGKTVYRRVPRTSPAPRSKPSSGSTAQFPRGGTGRSTVTPGPGNRSPQRGVLDDRLGRAARILTTEKDATRELFFTLADSAIYEPRAPALRGVEPDPAQREPLGLHGGGLPAALRTLWTEQGSLGPLAREEILALIPWAEDIEVGRPDLTIASPVVPMTSEIVRFVDRRMPPGRNVVTAYDASEGALYVLFALVLLFHPHTPRLLCVEGLDHALHPRLARALIRTMGAHVAAMRKQVVLATHNPLVLDGLDLANDDIRLFAVDRAESGETVIHRILYTEALAKAEQSGETLSRMWVQGLLGAVPDVW